MRTAIPIKQAIEDYLLARKADGVADKTLKWYMSILKAFADDCPKENMTSVTAKDMRLYIVELRERDERYVDAIQKPTQSGGVSDATISAHVRALKAFWSWSTEEYHLDENPMKRIRQPKRNISTPKSIDYKDFVKLFNVCTDDAMGDRDRAILAFLADTGCRLQGIRTLTFEHLYLGDKRALVHEKGKLTRFVFFTHFTNLLLNKWIAKHPKTCDSVFVSMRS